MPRYKVRCVCGAFLEITAARDTAQPERKKFIDDHRPCRELMDKNPQDFGTEICYNAETAEAGTSASP